MCLKLETQFASSGLLGRSEPRRRDDREGLGRDMEHGSATERGRKYVNLRRTTGQATDQSIGRRCVGDGAEYVGALRECRRALEREVVHVGPTCAVLG